MTKQIKRLLILLIILTATFGPTPLAHAEGGLVFKPYWTYRTDGPVTHLGIGDINGDGVLEVVILADNTVHVLENDGNLAWRYEADTTTANLLVDDLDGDGNAAEIFLSGRRKDFLLSDAQKPVWTVVYGTSGDPTIAAVAADLDGDGRPEIVQATKTSGIFSYDSTGFELDEPNRITSIDVWVGDVDGDGRPEIVPSPAGGNDVYVLQHDNRSSAWQKHLEDEVGLVQGGDVDGDGQAEVVVLSKTWGLFLLDNDGGQLWHSRAMSVENAPHDPIPGQLMVYDLNGDGHMEIVVTAPTPAAAVHVFDEAGRQLWQHPLEGVSTPIRLTAGDINGDGQAEVVVTTVGQGQVYLLDATGQRLAEYRPGETTGAVAYADLNNDGVGEVIIGTETGVKVFGVSTQAEQRQLWRSPFLAEAVALHVADLDGDGQGEVVAGSPRGQIYALSNEGQIAWEMNLEAGWVRALSSGDVDGDSQNEIVVGTGGGEGQLDLLDGRRSIWTVPQMGSITTISTRDLDGDGRAEIMIGSNFGSQGTAWLFDGAGKVIWQRELTEPVTAIDGDGGYVLVGTASGRIHRYLSALGSAAGEYELGARVLDIKGDLAAAADGRVYRLDESGPTVVRELGDAPFKVQIGPQWTAMLKDGQASVVSRDGSIWTGAVDGEAASIAIGDLNDDGESEIAVGTKSGRVYLFGMVLHQPPFLTHPDLAETRNGYAYSLEITNPEGDVVPVTLEIWDPSANDWLAQAVQSLDEGQDRGELTWNISEPFDMWDSGQESRFRFVYEVGDQQTTTAEIPGPFNIPTTPWYLDYGQRLGLGALILLVPALGLILYRRQRAHRRSPVGQAEVFLKQLQAQPDEVLTTLHTLTNDNPALLPYLSGAARHAGETAIADLSAGHNLLLVRPEVTAEDLRAVIGAIQRLDGPPDEKRAKIIEIFDLFRRALEANTVNRILALSVRLHELLTEAEAELGTALNDLNEVMKTLNNFQRVEAVEDKTAYLGQALEALGRLEREFRINMWQPEGNILARIAANWLLVVNSALQDLQGRAQIEATLKTRHLLNLNQASLSLELTNSGRSPASNVTISLVPDETFAVANGTVHLDVLAAGRSAVVELPISAAASVEQFRAEFNITFDDRERNGKRLAFADRVQLLRPTGEFKPMPNPYAPGTPLAPGSPIFFGRDDLFEFVTQNMAGLTRQNILVLIGQRRMGKTSFLQQLPARLAEEYLPVYLDGQSLGIDPGMAHFFYDLALAIVDALADQGIEIEEPEPEDFEERPSGTFERSFLPAIFEALGDRQLLLLFDEFEELEMRVTSGKLEATIFPFLRHLMQHNRKLGFIFVGTHRLEALSTDYWSIFFNIALYKHVVFLSEAAARALITQPVAEHGLVYDDLALDKMLRVTAGHPYFLQLTCHALVNHANREQRGYLTIQDVNSVLDEMVELGEAHFAFLWEQSSPSEQLVLSALTRLLGQEPTVTATQVVELLAERGITREVQDVIETLRQLVERDVIREIRGQPPRYEYKVELVRLWIERYKALGRVVEEVS